MSIQVSVNDFIVRATALALIDVPRANSQWDAKSGEVVPCQSVDICIAVATDKGLITPIVKDANKKSLTQISAEVGCCSRCGLLLTPLQIELLSTACAGVCAGHCCRRTNLAFGMAMYALDIAHVAVA